MRDHSTAASMLEVQERVAGLVDTADPFPHYQ
jgi:hypothetical protein